MSGMPQGSFHLERGLVVLAVAAAAWLVLSFAGPVATAETARLQAGSSVSAGTFSLVSDAKAIPIFFDSRDAAVVSIAAKALASDIGSVTGVVPTVSGSRPQGTSVLIVGTIGQSTLIDSLKSRGKLDINPVRAQREAYEVAFVKNPFPGVDRAMVIAGADRRGTAYGIFSISRKIGVSPWVWWDDLAPAHRDRIDLAWKTVIQGSPSVRYRGIFINDEDWSLRPWAARTLEPDVGNIGPETYKHVFELLLRLRANFLWPAMHQGTLAFNQAAANATLADQYAIVMGSSHAEPMLRNPVSEWNPEVNGPYDYASNGPALLKFWSQRVKANGKYDNVYTLGMRGIGDREMEAGGLNKVQLLDKIVGDQRSLFKKDLRRDPDQEPQAFWMYKEVLDIYNQGLKLPADITLGWVDDNYGYIRQLSDGKQQARSGGGGVYYHESYWGDPSDYLWLASTPPALINEEMTKAYQTNARRMWILNVGDIKPGEIGMTYFLDLAYDFNGTSALSEHAWLQRWAASNFGSAHADSIADMLTEYYRLGFQRKPEFMGWNQNGHSDHTTAFTPVAYGDRASERLQA